MRGEKEKGAFYWFCRHSRDGLAQMLRNHKALIFLSVVIFLVFLVLFRPIVHPLAIFLRIYSGAFLCFGLLLFSWLWMLKRINSWLRSVVAFFGVVSLITLMLYGGILHQYFSLYFCFRNLPIVNLSELPESGHERIQPLNSIFSLAHEVMTESEAPSKPWFVRVGTEYRWTMAVEPTYFISRLHGPIKQIINLLATVPYSNFSRENRVPVKFQVSEKLLLSKNVRFAIVRTFNLFRFFGYEAGDSIFIPDEQGQWLQVIPLLRWRGVIFPRPEFGGVHVIKQGEDGLAAYLRRFLVGEGEWIPPEEISKHEFLRGQSLMPTQVSRFKANSFRFRNGLFAPFPGYHLGDIRIPDLASDVNDQPFNCFFHFSDQKEGKLYHYFGLEPFDLEKQGLNTSIFIPGDGEPRIYAYNHSKDGSSITGVSTVSAKVMESKKTYDWNRNKPVEHRPFIKDLGGKRRFFWFTTVVTIKGEEDKSERFISGSVPEVVITDPTYNVSVWVNAMKPETWLSKIEEELSPIWHAQ